MAPPRRSVPRKLDAAAHAVATGQGHVERFGAQLHVEFRIDGTYFWWIDAHNTAITYTEFDMECVVYVGESRLPFRVSTDVFGVEAHDYQTFRSPVPTLANPQPHSALIENHWNEFRDFFDANCTLHA